MNNVSEKIYDRINQLLNQNNSLSEPILYTLGTKVAGGSLATHGTDCYNIGKFSRLSDDEILNLASATELAWTIILMYDDILDNDTIRYGKETSWVKFGKQRVQESIGYGLQVTINTHPYSKPFGLMYEECIQAMNNVKKLSMVSDVRAVEEAYKGYAFGCYDYLLPFDAATSQTLASIGYKEMLITQLLNDYKDTCGSRRLQRDYPELREKQANYITALYVETLSTSERSDFANSIETATSSEEYEVIAKKLKTNNEQIFNKVSLLTESINAELITLPPSDLKLYMEGMIKELIESLSSAAKIEIVN